MTQKNRAGEEGPIPSRSDRFYLLEDYWYFATREGAPIGPFEDRGEAERGLVDFLEFIDLAKPKIRKKLAESMAASNAALHEKLANFNTLLGHMLLGITHSVFAKVKDTGGQHCVGLTFNNTLR